MRLFPNPVQDHLFVRGVSSPVVLLRVADMAGRTVLESKVVGNGMDVSGLSSGTYRVTVVDGTYVTNTSFVKE